MNKGASGPISISTSNYIYLFMSILEQASNESLGTAGDGDPGDQVPRLVEMAILAPEDNNK